MAEQLGQAVLTVSADTRQLEAGLQRARQQAEQSGQQMGRAFEGFGNVLQGLAGLVGVVGLGALTQQIAQTGQESERSKVQLQALAGAYGEAGQAAAAAARVQSVLGVSALEARQNFSQLFAALRGTGIGVNQLEVLFVGLSKAARLSGASTAEASGALLQLRQGLASGVLQGDELRSVLENLPAFAQAVAKEMGVNVGQLRKLGSEGKITSEIVFNAAKSLASATVPGKTAAEDLGVAFTNLKEQAATAFGPAITDLIRSLTASIGAFSRFVNDNRQALGALGQSIVGIGRTLLPLVVGIQAVRAAMGAWALASKAVAVGQAAVLALSGPKGWAILAAGIAATAVAAKALDGAYKGVAGSVAAAKDEAAKAAKEFQQVLGSTNFEAPAPGQISPGKAAEQRLAASLSNIELRNAQERLAVARLINGQDDAGRLILQNRLALNEKIRAVDADRLKLQNELNKPRGTGDGQSGTQNQQTINTLQDAIQRGQIEVATLRLQNQQADAAALRTQQDRLRGQSLEAANARAKLGATQQQTQLERQALAAGVEVSRTAQLRLQQEEAIAAAKRQQASAQQALDAERRKPKAQQDRVVVDDLFSKVARANEGVRQAYADAGLALVQNARTAAAELKSAQQGFNSVARGGFNMLTPIEQRRQLINARASVQEGVNKGLIRPGLDTSTPEKLFAVANFAEQIVPAQERLTKAIDENRNATNALLLKDWNVYVSVPGQQTFVPLSNT